MSTISKMNYKLDIACEEKDHHETIPDHNETIPDHNETIPDHPE